VTIATLAILALAGPVGPWPTWCPADPDLPEYYAFPLVTTKNVPGTGLARGTAEVGFASSPFGVAVAPDGSYRLDVHLSFERLRAPRGGRYVAWVTTTDLDRIERLGPVDPSGGLRGRVSWNKFLVVVTLEANEVEGATAWSGPIVLRGMSRSGMMHTMAGHGAFQQESCAAYGYGS
jgi:hypothetical protein